MKNSQYVERVSCVDCHDLMKVYDRSCNKMKTTALYLCNHMDDDY